MLTKVQTFLLTYILTLIHKVLWNILTSILTWILRLSWHIFWLKFSLWHGFCNLPWQIVLTCLLAQIRPCSVLAYFVTNTDMCSDTYSEMSSCIYPDMSSMFFTDRCSNACLTYLLKSKHYDAISDTDSDIQYIRTFILIQLPIYIYTYT